MLTENSGRVPPKLGSDPTGGLLSKAFERKRFLRCGCKMSDASTLCAAKGKRAGNG